MKNLVISLALGVMLLATVSLAQDTTGSGKSKSQGRTIMGCLTHGSSPSSPDKFVLKGNDGSTWDVKGDSVPVAVFVGHTVAATGTVSNVTMHNAKEEAKGEAASAGTKKSNDEHGELDVSSVKLVSKSCK